MWNLRLKQTMETLSGSCSTSGGNRGFRSICELLRDLDIPINTVAPTQVVFTVHSRAVERPRDGLNARPTNATSSLISLELIGKGLQANQPVGRDPVSPVRRKPNHSLSQESAKQMQDILYDFLLINNRTMDIIRWENW